MMPNRAILLAIGLALFSIFGSVASIYSAWIVGTPPAWTRVAVGAGAIVLVLLVVLLLHTLLPVLRTNARRVSLVDAVRAVGLSDVESRNEGDRTLPPEALYSWPGLRELVVSGITAGSSFRNHLALIEGRLADKVDVYFLVCSEQTVGLGKISGIEGRNLSAEIQDVKSVIAEMRLTEDERFHIKTFAYLPSFTAVMINGDLDPRRNPPQDSKGVIRVQPRRMESTHHEGIVLQFENTGKEFNGFSLFATDLRRQWAMAEPWKSNTT